MARWLLGLPPRHTPKQQIIRLKDDPSNTWGGGGGGGEGVYGLPDFAKATRSGEPKPT